MDGRTPEEIRAETYADQNGSYFLGYGRESEPTESASQTITPHASHKPRSTGKHIVEPGGGDVSRDFANRDAIENPMTKEDKAKVRRGLGHSSALLMKEQLDFDRMMQRTEGDPRARAAALQKLADGKK